MISNDSVVVASLNNGGENEQYQQHQHANANKDSSSNTVESEDVSTAAESDADVRQMDLIDMEEQSFYSHSENAHGDDNIWGLLSGVAGNIYEWYDFAVYGLLSSEIGACFFPNADKKMQLVNSFGVFLAAFVMRPIGAILFGEIGDRMWGRKYALIMSIVMITVPSVLMGILPGYGTFGIAAPVILIVLRMIQGLSVGGQLAGSYVVSIEQSTENNRGFRGSICDASSIGGFLLASLVTTIVRNVFTDEQVNNWAWRLPFWFSLVLAPILYKIVNKTEESKLWAERAEQKDMETIIREVEHKEQTPAVFDLISSPFYRRQLMGMIFVLSALTSSFYVLMLWTPIYLSELRGLMAEKDADFINLCVVFMYIILVLCAGKLSDTFRHRADFIKIGLTGIIVAAPVMFGMFECESYWGIFLAQIQYAVCMSFVQGGIAAWEVELWMSDPTLSFTGVAVGHNLSSSIFGGTMPIIATYLFFYSDDMGKNESTDDTYNNDYLEEDSLYWRLLPGAFVSLLAMNALFHLSYVVRHPHDIRAGDKKLLNIQNLNKKLRKKRKQIQMGELGAGSSSWVRPVLSWDKPADKSDLNGYVPPQQ